MFFRYIPQYLLNTNLNIGEYNKEFQSISYRTQNIVYIYNYSIMKKKFILI